jgi:hypothetical protein
MDEMVMRFRERTNRYIEQCDALYAYLLEPFVVFQEPVFDDLGSDDTPDPIYLIPGETFSDSPLPSELFDL